MGSTVISHIIGTVTLLVLFGIIGVYYTTSYSSLQSEIIASNLQGVADYVSSEIVDLVSLCSLSVGDQLLIKKIKIPETIGKSIYNLTIIESEGLLKVLVSLSSDPSVYGDSILPWSTGSYLVVFNGTDPGIDNSRITPMITILSVSNDPVVWCLKKDEGKMTFGLGVMEA